MSRVALLTWTYGPGLTLTSAIAATASVVPHLVELKFPNSLILALVTGIVIRNLIGVPAALDKGIAFSARELLRFAIVLLGMQVTVGQIWDLGGIGLSIVLVSFLATYLFTVAAGSITTIDPKMVELIAAGTSVCGASAIMAMRTVNNAQEQDVTYAIASITVIGSAFMVIFPLTIDLLRFDENTYGLWVGTSLHEVAQVVGTGFQVGRNAGEVSVITKLARVLLLAPLLVVVAWRLSYSLLPRPSIRSEEIAPPIPWFVAGFVLAVALNSALRIPTDIKTASATIFSFLLALAIGALGLQTDFSKLRQHGLAPFLLCVAASIFLAILSAVLLKCWT